MIEDIQELLSKYRRHRDGALRCIARGVADNQSPSFRNGQIDILDRIIDDLRNLVLDDRRSGV